MSPKSPDRAEARVLFPDQAPNDPCCLPPSRALRANAIRIVWWLRKNSDLQTPPQDGARGLISYQELQMLLIPSQFGGTRPGDQV